MKKIPCHVTRVSPNDGWHYFFGYYDKCPWSSNGKRLLAHRARFLDHFPLPDDKAEIGWVENGAFYKIAETSAWNWQQGSQLQWLYGHNDELIIFNIRDSNNSIRACIYNPATGLSRYANGSVYTVHPQGNFALTLNYARLYDMRKDYGIAGLSDEHQHEMLPEDDGIYSINLNEDQSPKLILSIAYLYKHFCSDHPKNVKYKINHLMFNPSGTRFCFMLRYTSNDGLGQSLFFTANADGTQVRKLRTGMISHYGWSDDAKIIAWAGERKIFGISKNHTTFLSHVKRLLKPLYYAIGKPRILMNKVIGDSYFFIYDFDKASHKIAEGKLVVDGHCSVWNNRWLLTDGYTDFSNRLPLYIYDLKTDSPYEIGRFFTPRELDKELRVDLHPRWSRDGKKVCIDSAMDGRRAIYVIDVENIVGETC
jgi:hypothetical protein